MLLFAAFLASSAQAKHDWTVHPEQLKSKFVSNLRGWVTGTTVVTNSSTIPPTGIYYPGIGVFTNLVRQGAKFVCYNKWEGPEVGTDADLPFDAKKKSWFYKDSDEPTVKYAPAKRNFSYVFPQKEYSELDYCLVLNDVIYPVNVSAINSKLMYKGVFAEDFASGLDISKDRLNMGLYSAQTNNWFIGDPISLSTVNNIVYKGGATLFNGCKIKVSFNTRSWVVKYKITDPVSSWVRPGSSRELGVKSLKLDGLEITNGMHGDGFLFTNDVLVLQNYRGRKIEFSGGLDIMCPPGSTNVFESQDHALSGSRGFCNFLGQGKVVFRGPQTALKLDDCAMLLNEINSFNADDMPEVVVANEYYCSAPSELVIDGKSAMYNKEGKGWKYKQGALYLNNFQCTNIYCDGYLKVFLEPKSENYVHGLFDSGFGDVCFFGNTGASLSVGSFSHSNGDLSFSNMTLNVTKADDSVNFSISEGNLYGRGSTISLSPNEGFLSTLSVAGGNIALTNCALNVTANNELAIMAGGNLHLKSSSLSIDGTLETDGDARFFDSQVSVENAGDLPLYIFGNLLSADSVLDLGAFLDVCGTADILGGKVTLFPDNYEAALSVQDLMKARNAEINITGSASFLTNAYFDNCVCDIFSKETNAFLCGHTVSLTETKLTATSLTKAIGCKDFLADSCNIAAKTIRDGFGLVSDTVTLKGRDGELSGNVKCGKFLMESGNFTANGDVALASDTSVEFRGGNALLTGLSEAILCPFDVIVADGSGEKLGGFKLIEIKNGFVSRKE